MVHADVRSTGTFASSDPLLNQIWQNNRWTILNNSMSIPTDNPVRDERTPPGMDVQAYHDASTREFDMDRFYANFLGQRDGLKAPLSKAEALAEAKHWLRTLPRPEALKLAAQLTGGAERGKGRPALPLAPVVPETAREDEPPYAHPYYWAAFVLVGDGD